MKQESFLIRSTKWISSCVVFGIALGTTNAQAVTLSRANTAASFNQFSQAALSTNTDTDTISNAVTFSGLGAISSDADAEALFIQDPAEINNFVRTEAFTSTPAGLAQARGEASVLGNFGVDAGESFSFDFFSQIDLLAATDNPTQELATASASVVFNLFNISNSSPVLLDIFQFSAGISTNSNNDFLALNISDESNFVINETLSSGVVDFTGSEKAIQAQVFGRYQRSFETPTLISLIEVKRGEAFGESGLDLGNGSPDTAIPEPTTSILIGCLLSTGILMKKKQNRGV